MLIKNNLNLNTRFLNILKKIFFPKYTNKQTSFYFFKTKKQIQKKLKQKIL